MGVLEELMTGLRVPERLVTPRPCSFPEIEDVFDVDPVPDAEHVKSEYPSVTDDDEDFGRW